VTKSIKWICAIAGFLLLVSTGTRAAEAALLPSLIPWPAKIESAPGGFTVSGQTNICATGAANAVAQQLQAVIAITQGLNLKTSDCGRAGISLRLSSSAAVADAEGYTLDVSATGVRIEARTAAGLYYGAMTAAQLVTTPAKYGVSVRLAGIHIEDFPRFKWRGLLLDPARHFVPVADVKMILDQMGQHKLNVLHLHLTDDQGWRIEIQRYPELTKIGAWRTPPSNGGPGSETAVYGGFYTQENIREMVAYAAARHITVVPEIDLPGHAQAVVAAHPKIGVLGDQPQVSSNWGVNEYLYNTNAESLTFVKNVLDEIIGLFPGLYVHLGGDEAIKDQWKASPAVQAQMKALGIADEDAMQSWFMEQIGLYLAEHGRTMVGWDEILEGGVPSNATVMSWRGTQGAIVAARAGHDVVLSPAPTLYFDNLQSARDDEPAGRLGIVPLSQVYNFEVMPTVLSAEDGRHVLGAQANLWSEYLLSSGYLQHAAFPRVDALSEAVWSQSSNMSWAGFLARLPAQMQRYRRQNIAAADSAFAVDFQIADGRNAILHTGAGALTLVNQTAFGEIRYTLDGSEPSPQSKRYSTPLVLGLGAVVTATAFSKEGWPLAAARTYHFTTDTLLARSSNQLQVCASDTLRLRLPLTPNSPAVEPAFNVDLFHSCYIYPKALLTDVAALRFSIARLARNFGLANHKNQVKSYPARTPFGELVVYQDRCETGAEMARVALPDPAHSDNLQSVYIPIVPGRGEHDLCFILTASTSGPLYAVGEVKLLRADSGGPSRRAERSGGSEDTPYDLARNRPLRDADHLASRRAFE
jgi:hexosaminidase